MQTTHNTLLKNLIQIKQKNKINIQLKNVFKDKTKEEIKKCKTNFNLFKFYLKNEYLKKYNLSQNNQTMNFECLVVEAKDGEVRF